MGTLQMILWPAVSFVAGFVLCAHLIARRLQCGTVQALRETLELASPGIGFAALASA